MNDMPNSDAAGTNVAVGVIAAMRCCDCQASIARLLRADPGAVAGNGLVTAQRRKEARRAADRLLR